MSKVQEGLQEIKLLVIYLDLKKKHQIWEKLLKYFQLSSSRNNETKIQGFRMAVLKRMLCKVQIRICSIVVVMVT